VAIYLTISGLDDLFVDFAWVAGWLRAKIKGVPLTRTPQPDDLQEPERPIAIFVPLWHEHAVIGSMLSHNIAAIRYENYAFFIGAYPNDEPTISAVREAESRSPRVHLCICPHDGPTSKADCLNWIYQRMLLEEERAGIGYELIVTHDAEDIIHADSLKWMNFYATGYDFIQIPVLALHTPMTELTHGMYCDEFAEFQTRDLPVRNRLGGFVPSAGVGTAYSRRALEAMAEVSSNRIFEPACLTEDYENGFRLRELGFRQIFVPPSRSAGSWVATREYFPRDRQSAIRQRTRWVTGIALQGWQRHGWSGGWKQAYWLWRDRKGLIGSPLSLATNLLTVYGLLTHMWDRVSPPPVVAAVFWSTLVLQLGRTLVRMGFTGRIYGGLFALLVPLRTLHANAINASATVRALFRYARARWRHEPLVWVKTSHSYPSRAALIEQRRKIGEILVGSGYVEAEQFEQALASQPGGRRIGEYLISLGLLTEDDLYEALAIQQGLPLGAPSRISRNALRTLPAHVLRDWKVLPFRVAAGQLLIAASDIPTEALHSTLRDYTSLEVRFHLVTPTQFEEMRRTAQ
jgi:adsorption protein B